jgi:anti-sigma factor RsiW
MDGNCKFTEERLSDYLEQQMTPQEMAAFSSHVAACPTCARLVQQVRGTVRQMRALEPVREPAHLVSKILEATSRARPEKQSRRGFFGWSPLLWQPRFAMGMATVAASLVIVFHFVGVTPGKIKRADLSPANVVRSANRQVHLAYARSAKIVNDLRVVYEIQSALQHTSPLPEPEPSTEPKSESPSANPEQKSQTEPHPRSQVRSGIMVAALMNTFAGSSR